MLYLHAIRVVSLLIYLSKTVADLMGIIYVAGMGIVVVHMKGHVVGMAIHVVPCGSPVDPSELPST